METSASIAAVPESLFVPPESLFVPDGTHWVPTDAARGPWTPDALHGGPVAALLSRALEHCSGSEALQVARLTVELMRPVPVRPLSLRSGVFRPGRKIQLAQASVLSGESELARATALFIRRAELPIPEQPTEPVVPGPDHGRPLVSGRDNYAAFHTLGAELRFVEGAFESLGPATVWVRLRQPVVPDEDPSPLQRVAAAADFGNGVSAVLEFQKWLFVNPDLTVYLRRPPEGEWVCLDAVTHAGSQGMGLAESTLYDPHGPIGRSLQSLLLDRVV